MSHHGPEHRSDHPSSDQNAILKSLPLLSSGASGRVRPAIAPLQRPAGVSRLMTDLGNRDSVRPMRNDPQTTTNMTRRFRTLLELSFPRDQVRPVRSGQVRISSGPGLGFLMRTYFTCRRDGKWNSRRSRWSRHASRRPDRPWRTGRHVEG